MTTDYGYFFLDTVTLALQPNSIYPVLLIKIINTLSTLVYRVNFGNYYCVCFTCSLPIILSMSVEQSWTRFINILTYIHLITNKTNRIKLIAMLYSGILKQYLNNLKY